VTNPDHDESKPRRRWPTYLAVVLVLMLVVYPLSSGPVIALWYRVGGLPIHYDTLYGPLNRAAMETPGGDILISYQEWWMDRVFGNQAFERKDRP
jgi:hypothetical protein